MAGQNRYFATLEMAARRRLDESSLDLLLSNKALIPKPTQPCIFLSHKSEDNSAVKAIGDYIKKRGVDIYLDVDDPDLQKAVKNDDHVAITKSIELGIHASTDLMTLISEKTKSSWWVPYEVGFAKSEQKFLSTLKLKSVSYIPSFLFITKLLKGAKALDQYIDGVRNRNRVYARAEILLNEMSRPSRSTLSNYLNISE
jgi:hypothetical protein